MKEIEGIKGIRQLNDLGYYVQSNQLVLFQKLSKSGDIVLFHLFQLKPFKSLYYFIAQFKPESSYFIFKKFCILISPNGAFDFEIDFDNSTLGQTSFKKKKPNYTSLNQLKFNSINGSKKKLKEVSFGKTRKPKPFSVWFA